jgi:hypothetical protein
MKQLIPIVALFITPYTVYADSQRQCNIALDKTATYLRSQSAITDRLDNSKKPSRAEIEAQIRTSQNIIDVSKRVLSLCELDQEMTEGIVDLIIDNKEKLKKIAYDVDRNE